MRNNVEKTKDYLLETIADLEIGNDAAYDALLAERKHLTALSAPPEFRALLTYLAPFRFDLSRGVEEDSGTVRFYWYIGEFGAEGGPEAVRERIASFLEKEGFASTPAGTAENGLPRLTFLRETSRFRHQLTLTGPERFTGTKTARSGGSLLYLVTVKELTAGIVWDGLFASIPALRAENIPDGFLSLFPGKTISRAEFGGTWERYYSWTWVFRLKNPEEADTFLSLLQAVAAAEGFSVESEYNGITTYMKKGTAGPVVYLGKDEPFSVCFRIQPTM